MGIQYEFVRNERGEIVHVSDAEKGLSYFCANKDCGGEMIFRSGDIRAHHFAHKHKDFDHKGESILHYNTKLLLFDYIKKFVCNGDPLYVQFECEYCCGIHGINILDGIDAVYMEKGIGGICRPDISLFSGDDAIIALEVVVTHDVESHVMEYMRDNGIKCLKVFVDEKLYSILLERYCNYDPNILYWLSDVDIIGICTSDYCHAFKVDTLKKKQLSILANRVRFRSGKHEGKNVKYVYKNDMRYLYRMLRRKHLNKDIFTDEIIRVVSDMHSFGYINWFDF